MSQIVRKRNRNRTARLEPLEPRELLSSADAAFTPPANLAPNAQPTFTAAAPQTTTEDAGLITESNWATFNPGAGEIGQTATFNIFGVTNPSLFTAPPAVAPDGTLTYTLAPDANGTSAFVVTVTDSGGTDLGGVDTSEPQTFTITVTPVNDAPSFTASNVTVNEDAGAVTLPNWSLFNPGGGSDESTQTASYVTSDISNVDLFSSMPSLSPDGTLTFTTAPNAHGVSTFTAFVADLGSVESGGPQVSSVQTFTITIQSVNDQPTFFAADPPAIDEDAAAVVIPNWAIFDPSGGADEFGQTPTYQTSAPSNPALFSSAPSVSASGTLTYTAAPNANGIATFTVLVVDSGGTANGGINTSITQTFTVAINAVNDRPAFSAVSPPTVNEDPGIVTVPAWANFDAGGGSDESVQTAAYTIASVTNSALFATLPAVASNGTLTYTPALNANGSATVVVFVKDSGGTASNGIDTSFSQTFTITVDAVNDQPTFAAENPPAVNEDSSPVALVGWAVFNPGGGADEAGQTPTYAISAPSNAALFLLAPSLSNSGALTYTPAPDANGTATFTATVTDSGDTARGGVNLSATRTFTITVNAVNDQPSFTAVNPPVVNEDPGVVTVANWATFAPGGGSDESAQSVTYTVSAVSNVNFFTTLPAISPNGTLTYTPAPGINGNATFTVTATDSGGVANGGVNASTSKTFTLFVNAVNQAPTFIKGPDILILQNSGDFRMNQWATQISHGPPNEASQALTFILSDYDTTLFSTQPAIDPNTGTLTFIPKFGAFGGTNITLTLQDSGGTANGGHDQSVQTFAIDMAIEFGVVQGKKNVKAVIADQDGTHGTFTLSGNGTGRVISRDDDLFDVSITGADKRTSLKVTTDKVGNGAFDLRHLSVPISSGVQFIGKIDAPNVNMTGALTVSGSVGSVKLGNVTHGGTWTIGLPQSGKESVSLGLGIVSDLSLTSTTVIKSLTAIDWSEGGGALDVITAPYINTISITGSRANAALGNFEAGMVLTAQGAPNNVALSKFTAARDITRGEWKIAGGIGTITARATGAAWHIGTTSRAAGEIKSITTTGGALSGVIQAISIGAVKAKTDFRDISWTITQPFAPRKNSIASISAGGEIKFAFIRSTGSIGAITALTMSDSKIFVGVKASVSTLPAVASDIDHSDATIASLTLKGLEETPSFARSLVAAGTLAKVTLKDVDPSNNGGTTGFAADILKSYVRGTFKLNNIDLANANLDPEPGGDFVVRTL